MSSGDDIRRARTAVPMTQAVLAGAAGVSERTVMRAERGDAVAAETVMALRAALGIPATARPPETDAARDGAQSQTGSSPDPATPRRFPGRKVAALALALLVISSAMTAGGFCARVTSRFFPAAEEIAAEWNTRMDGAAARRLGHTASAFALAFDDARTGTAPVLDHGFMGQASIRTRAGKYGIGPLYRGDFTRWDARGNSWGEWGAAKVAQMVSARSGGRGFDYMDMALAGFSAESAWIRMSGVPESTCLTMLRGLPMSDAYRLRVAGHGTDWPDRWSALPADPADRGPEPCGSGSFLHVLVLRAGTAPPEHAPPPPSSRAGAAP